VYLLSPDVPWKQGKSIPVRSFFISCGIDIFTYGTLIMKLEKRVRGVMRPAAAKLPALMHAAARVIRANHPAAAIALTLALMTAGVSLHAQTYPFREYTSDDGLPQTQSMNMMQDSRGYLWIPTRNGLARFDGNSFISYLRKDGLPSNMVNRVEEDKNGTVWAVTINGVARFNGKSFIGYPIPDSLGIKQVGSIPVILDTSSFLLSASIDFDNQILLLFENGIYSNFTAANPQLQGRKLTAIARDPEDRIIYLIDEKSAAYSFDDGILRKEHQGPVTNIQFKDGKPHFENRTIWSPQTTEPFYWEKGGLSLYFADRDGTVWAGTETSVYRLISRAFVEYDRENGLPEETWAVVADHRGGLWTGSIYGELRYFDGKKFISRNDYRDIYGKPATFYRGSTLLSNGEIWFSTQEGILAWDGKKFRIPEITPENIQICIIYEDPVDKSILVGADQGLYHIRDGKVMHYPQMSWPGYGIVEGIARDHEGHYWLAGHYGIVFFDGKNFVPFRSAPAPAEMVWGVICDYRGNIWSAGSDGIFICDPDKPAFDEALPHEINLPANVIRDLGDHRLIVGRMMDICIIDLEKYYTGQPDYYKIIDRSRGFLGNDCQDNGIVRDSDGDWWILTTGKLIRFDPDMVTKKINPPMNHITRVEIPGDSTVWETALEASLFYDSTSFLKIRGRQNSIRISYTGISTMNPENVRYQYRMKGLSDNWSKMTAERSVVYTDLPTRSYTFEVQAINADGVYSVSPDSLYINVVPTFLQSTFAIVMFVFLTLSLIVFLSWQIRKSVLERRVAAARIQAETYRLQLNSVIKQFDPHFTFNAVTSVGSLIMKGEKEKAYNYFIKLSNLLRSIITDSNLLLKPLMEELEFVKRYCELQKLRFGERFTYNIDVAPEVNLKSPVPKMIIQSFAENAVKHGLENKAGQGTMDIRISNLDSGVEVTIRDNGIGRAAAARLHTAGAGTGLKNIRGIIDTINRANREKITFDLTDLYDNGKPAGTEVRVFLPYNYSFNFQSDKIE
jgi:ligand-binding sensor domain-containing protein